MDMDDRSFGARFIEEMRRLTQSTVGFDYREVQRISQMSREEFRAALGDRLAPSTFWEDPAAGSEPESLARAVFESQSSDAISVIVGMLGGLT